MTLAFWQAGNLPAAGRSVRDWARLDPERPAPHRFAARIYEDMGAIDLAAEAADRAAARAPRDADAWERVGRLRLRLLRPRRRARRARARPRGSAPSVEGLLDLALAHHLAGDLGGEVAATEQATLAGAATTPRRGRATRTRSRAPTASATRIAASERALQLEPDDAEVADLLERLRDAAAARAAGRVGCADARHRRRCSRRRRCERRRRRGRLRPARRAQPRRVGGAARLADPPDRRPPRAGRRLRRRRLRARDRRARRRARHDRARARRTRWARPARRGRRARPSSSSRPTSRRRCAARASRAASLHECTDQAGDVRAGDQGASSPGPTCRRRSRAALDDAAARPVYVEIPTDLLAGARARRAEPRSPRQFRRTAAPSRRRRWTPQRPLVWAGGGARGARGRGHRARRAPRRADHHHATAARGLGAATPARGRPAAPPPGSGRRCGTRPTSSSSSAPTSTA